jgi:SagB-type dehydrogenase family enzyme
VASKFGERWIVSGSALVSWRAGRIEIASPVSGAVFQTDNPDILSTIHAFARATPIEEVVRKFRGYAADEIVACIDQLIDAGILIRLSKDDPMTVHRWERSALAFHRKSRGPRFLPGPSHDATPLGAHRSPRTIPLDRRSLEEGRDLAHILEARRSRRVWPNRTIAREAFSSLLWMSARDRDVAPEVRRDHLSRPYPSGGAVYSLELYPVIALSAVESIMAGVYRYLPELHGLEPLSTEAVDYQPFLDAAGRSAGSDHPPVVLVVTSRFAKQSAAYGDLAYSLVLKEVGALFQTLYLVAEHLELAGCALGGGTPDELLARLCNTTDLAEPVVGEFMVGPR